MPRDGQHRHTVRAVPLRLGRRGPILGVAAVSPDGSAYLQLLPGMAERLGLTMDGEHSAVVAERR